LETIGRNKYDSQLTLANLVNNVVLPHNEPKIQAGVEALFSIHNNTNELVMQGNSKLNDVLTEKDTVRTYVLALQVEVMEFLQTLDWKPWKNGKQESDERVLDEFADMIAFMGVLITILKAMGFSEADIANAYIRKEQTNVARFLQKAVEDSK
jgi:dimeric dUTPase (all-alpha-NTP-PPase superfamily)